MMKMELKLTMYICLPAVFTFDLPVFFPENYTFKS